MQPLTDSQRRVYRAVVRLSLAGAVSVRDVSAECGIAEVGAADTLHILRRKGYVTWEDNLARTLRPVVPRGTDWDEHRELVVAIGEGLRE